MSGPTKGMQSRANKQNATETHTDKHSRTDREKQNAHIIHASAYTSSTQATSHGQRLPRTVKHLAECLHPFDQRMQSHTHLDKFENIWWFVEAELDHNVLQEVLDPLLGKVLLELGFHVRHCVWVVGVLATAAGWVNET